jgi:glycosyltransferase involved in cell wall biosynthesis
MRILFCVPDRITTELGAPKVYVEIASALEKLGCSCELVGLEDVAPGISDLDGRSEKNRYYAKRLRRYILDRSDEFDVVEYDHQSLPYPRSDFSNEVLLVARSVLLGHHAKNLDFPTWQGIPLLMRNAFLQLVGGERTHDGITTREYLQTLKRHVGTAVRYRSERPERLRWISQATDTCRNADLVIVSNTHDVEALAAEDIDTDKVVRLPFGLTEERFEALSSANTGVQSNPVVIFVGTFDFRKGGATDLPRIAEYIVEHHPAVRFRLLGTEGLFQGKRQILAHFHPSIRRQIEVVSRYIPEELPDLLNGGSIGIFPSYYEGFPFGVLEMLAAGLPVVAYHAPGPPEMVPNHALVDKGAWKALAREASDIIDSGGYQTSEEARNVARNLDWREIAIKTLDLYRSCL